MPRKLARLLTVQQVHAEYGPPVSTLYELIASGTLPAVRFRTSRTWWVPRRDLDTLIARSRVRPNGHAPRPLPADRGPLTIAEAARLAHVCPSTVSHAIKRRQLRTFTRCGGVSRWVWRRDGIRKVLLARRQRDQSGTIACGLGSSLVA